MLNKKKILALSAISILAISVSAWGISTYSQSQASKSAAVQQEPVNINEHLMPYFKQIMAYYEQNNLSFVIEQTEFEGEKYQEVTHRQVHTVHSGTNYFSSTSGDIMMFCNHQVSVLIDKTERNMYVDSAWDKNALHPSMAVVTALLASYDTIQFRTLPSGTWEFIVPGKGGNMQQYTQYLVHPTQHYILEINIYNMVAHGYNSEDVVPIRYQMLYSQYNTSAQPPAYIQDASQVVRWQGNKLKGQGPYASYQVQYKNQQF